MTPSVMASREVHVTPTKEQLSIEERIRCPVEGCGKEFLSSSRLLMHTMRRHEGRRLTSVAPGNGNRVFFCPVEQCVRSKGGKPFSRLGKLKQVRHQDVMDGCARAAQIYSSYMMNFNLEERLTNSTVQ